LASYFYLNKPNQKVSKQQRKEKKWYFNIQIQNKLYKKQMFKTGNQKKIGYMKRFQITNFSIFAMRSKVPVQSQL